LNGIQEVESSILFGSTTHFREFSFIPGHSV
jgi:hypothetical protein